MNVWEWISTTTTVDSLLTTLGIGTLAFLFARDLILTKAQHLRRVQDIINAHEMRIADLISFHARERLVLEAARDEWKEAATAHRERAQKAEASLAESASTQKDVLHVLESLDRALPREVKHG